MPTKRREGAPSAQPAKRKKGSESEPGAHNVHFVIAHAAGHHPAGCKHTTLQIWAAALAKYGTVHDALVYPKPFNLMARLVSAHEKVISATPCDAKVVLVGVGMGARVAVHLMSGMPGDDGKPLPEVPQTTRERVALMVAVDYPLLRVGTREVRSAPLLSLPDGSPPLLFVHGPTDKHSDLAKLDSIRKRMKSRAEVVELQSGSESPNEKDLSLVVDRIVNALA